MSAIFTHLRDLAYDRLRGHEGPFASADEWYACVRAALVLGDYASVATTLARGVPEGAEAHAEFLHLQRAIFVDGALDAARDRLLALTAAPPVQLASDYLVAELHFLAGYVHNLRDDFRAGVAHHEQAASRYQRAGLVGGAAVALYNLCVALDHLNERKRFLGFMARLGDLARDSPSPAVHLPYVRLRACLAMDREEYAAAHTYLLEAIEICRVTRRARDFGSLVCSAAYVEALHVVNGVTSASLASEVTEPMHRVAWLEIERAKSLALVDRQAAIACVTRWESLGLPGTMHLNLLHILLHKVQAAGEDALLVRLARRARRMAGDKQQGPGVIDFRPFEILGLARGGKIRAARLLFYGCAADARDGGIPARLEKVRALSEILQNAEPGESGFVVDLVKHEARLGGVVVDLSQKPLVERLLALLVEAQRPLSLGELFEALYDLRYDPIKHEMRLHSLVARARRMLPNPRLLARRGGQIAIRSDVDCQLIRPEAGAESAERRRLRLQQLIEDAGRPLTMSDITSHFDESRRTLQLDLARLVKARLVQAHGQTRDRHYEAGASS